jgi:hypothetical protein
LNETLAGIGLTLFPLATACISAATLLGKLSINTKETRSSNYFIYIGYKNKHPSVTPLLILEYPPVCKKPSYHLHK